jgi:prephenate dehydratase
MMTTFIFRVRNVPAALYKAMGGFATNGVNMTKLESYQLGAFTATLFYADIEGHPEDQGMSRTRMEELKFLFKAKYAFSAFTPRAISATNGRSPTERRPS